MPSNSTAATTAPAASIATAALATHLFAHFIPSRPNSAPPLTGGSIMRGDLPPDGSSGSSNSAQTGDPVSGSGSGSAGTAPAVKAADGSLNVVQFAETAGMTNATAGDGVGIAAAAATSGGGDPAAGGGDAAAPGAAAAAARAAAAGCSPDGAAQLGGGKAGASLTATPAGGGAPASLLPHMTHSRSKSNLGLGRADSALRRCEGH